MIHLIRPQTLRHDRCSIAERDQVFQPDSTKLHYSIVADLLADVRRVQQVGDVFGPASTALSTRKVAERALEYDDAEVRSVAQALLAELERNPALCPRVR